MKNVSIRQLRYFEALARHRHFGRAARACAISQPALSVQVRQMEEVLGAPLVERGARHVRLTSLGAAFAERARAILRSLDDLGDLARASTDRLAGQLRLGVIPTVAPYLLPGLVGALAGCWPALDLRPREAITQKLIADLEEGRLDAAIVALPVSEPGLAGMALFAEDFVLVRPRDEAHLPVPAAEALAGMRLLLLEEGHCFRDQALSFCGLAAEPRELMEGTSLATLVQMVGAGLGVTLIPEMAISIETRAAPVSVARLPPPAPSRTIGMVWRRTTPLSEQLGRIGAMIREAGNPPSAPGERGNRRRALRAGGNNGEAAR